MFDSSRGQWSPSTIVAIGAYSRPIQYTRTSSVNVFFIYQRRPINLCNSEMHCISKCSFSLDDPKVDITRGARTHDQFAVTGLLVLTLHSSLATYSRWEGNLFTCRPSWDTMQPLLL